MTKTHILEKICHTCISEDMAFQRTIKSHDYCVARHQGKYKAKEGTRFVGRDYDIFAHECKYKEKGK